MNKSFKIKAFGASMEPIFRDGDVLEVEKVPYSRLKVGDIVTFRLRELYITHRIIYKTKNYVKTAGDNNLSVDKNVKPKQILGKVVEILRNKILIHPELIYLHQSSVYLKEIIRLKKIWERENINFVYLKGLPIHVYFQKSIPKRVYADCDVLIDSSDEQEVERVLYKEGYSLTSENKGLLPRWLRVNEPEKLFSKIIDGVRVSFDVHSEVAFMIKQFGGLHALYPKKLTDSVTRNFLSEKRHINIDGETFNILSKTNLILYLALHIFSHNLKGYYLYELLADLIRRQKPNFEDIAGKALGYKIVNYIYPVFYFINKYYQPLSGGFLLKIKPKENDLKFIRKSLLKTNIWARDIKVERGENRFKYLFFLSPNSIMERLTVFLKPHVLYAIGWVFLARIRAVAYKSKL